MDSLSDLQHSLQVSKRRISEEERREKRQARIGLASNVVGLGAGVAATGAALTDDRLVGGDLARGHSNSVSRTVHSVGRKIPKPIQRLQRKHPKLAPTLAVGGAALQLGNIGGDAVANRVLARSAKKDDVKKSFVIPRAYQMRPSVETADATQIGKSLMASSAYKVSSRRLAGAVGARPNTSGYTNFSSPKKTGSPSTLRMTSTGSSGGSSGPYQIRAKRPAAAVPSARPVSQPVKTARASGTWNNMSSAVGTGKPGPYKVRVKQSAAPAPASTGGEKVGSGRLKRLGQKISGSLRAKGNEASNALSYATGGSRTSGIASQASANARRADIRGSAAAQFKPGPVGGGKSGPYQVKKPMPKAEPQSQVRYDIPKQKSDPTPASTWNVSNASGSYGGTSGPYKVFKPGSKSLKDMKPGSAAPGSSSPSSDLVPANGGAGAKEVSEAEKKRGAWASMNPRSQGLVQGAGLTAGGAVLGSTVTNISRSRERNYG